jgi:hypothetical protein
VGVKINISGGFFQKSFSIMKTRKRKKATDETVKKKVKDNFIVNDKDNLDLTSDVKPILSIGLTPPSNEIIQIEIDNDNGK